MINTGGLGPPTPSIQDNTNTKQNQMTTHTFVLPDHWASPLINNDWTGIDDHEEEKCILQFLADNPGSCCIDVKEDSSFVKYHDAADYGVLASNCSTFIFN